MTTLLLIHPNCVVYFVISSQTLGLILQPGKKTMTGPYSPLYMTT